MAQNDPYFNSRYMQQGTAGAEFIYNEFLGRLAATGFRLNSRSLSDPPGSPVSFDAYLVPAGAINDWAGLDGTIVFWLDAWYSVPVQPGMHVYIEDESTWVNFPTATASQATAIDGDLILTPEFTTSWILNWDAGGGVAASVTLANSIIAQTPTNMVAGRRYVLRVTQDGVGGHLLNLQNNGWVTLDGNSPVAIDTTADAVSDVHILGPMAPWDKPTIYNVQAPVLLVNNV